MVTASLRAKIFSDKIKDPARLMREWPARGRKLRSQFTYLATEYAHRDLLNRIPHGREFDAYRESLELAQIPVGSQEDAFAIYSNPKAQKVRKVDGRRTLLYVRPKRRSRKVPPEVLVLESYGPWTLDTLPFKPNPKDAALISRKVPYREVLRISELLRRRRPEWKKALNELGIRQLRTNQGIAIPKGLEAIPDVALDGIKLEFGLGTKAKAHWRPMLLGLQKRGLREMLKQQKELTFVLIKSEFQRWSKWPTPIKKIKTTDARKFVGFQKRLGIRVSK